MGEEPADRDSQVLLFHPQPVGPFDLSFGGPARVRHELGEVLGVSLRNVRTGAASSEPLGGELAHRHEHAEAGFDVVRDDADEAVAGERVEKIQRLVLRPAADARSRHRASIRPRTPTRPPTSSRSCVVEESEAPLDRRPQGALALGQVARSRAQGVENVFESVEQRGGWEHPGASRGELDR